MKHHSQLISIPVVLFLMLSGCSITREPMRPRDDFFRPMTMIPQRNRSALSSSDLEQLKSQLELATKVAITLRDSLASLQNFTGSILSSTRALVDKVTELETKEYLTTNRQKDLEQSVAQLQIENKELANQLNEIRSRLLTGNIPNEKQVFTPARSYSNLRDEYSVGLSLFQQKKYDSALDTFSELIDKGIEEDLSDNCEYWKGECHFAQQGYPQAINSFQKVLEIQSSNKKIDAYFMLGKSYEQTGELSKARWAYEELNLLYPDNSHANVVKYRLNILKRTIPAPSGNVRGRTTT